MAAAETIRATDDGAAITVVCADPYGYYSRPGVAYYLSRELPRDLLFPFGPDDLRGLGVTWVTETAVAVDAAAHTVMLQGGRRLSYDRLLLATGSQAIRPQVLGAELDGVVTLDGMDDGRDIVRRCAAGGAAVVVGGGITALEIVEGLRARRMRVHYLLRRERYWSNVLSEAESRIVETALRREGVEVHAHTELAAIHGREGRVAAVETVDGDVIPCGVVALAVGVRPAAELARDAGLPCDRGVLVDDRLCAGDPDVFAAGDIAETKDPETGRRTLHVLWNTALRKGRVAGANMAARPGAGPRTYVQDIPLNVTRLAGLHTTIIGRVGSGADADLQGLSRGDSQTWSDLRDREVVEAQRGDAHIRLALDGRAIAGAVVMGDQTLSRALQELVEARADVSRAIPALEAPQAPIADIINGLWTDWMAGGGGDDGA